LPNYPHNAILYHKVFFYSGCFLSFTEFPTQANEGGFNTTSSERALVRVLVTTLPKNLFEVDAEKHVDSKLLEGKLEIFVVSGLTVIVDMQITLREEILAGRKFSGFFYAKESLFNDYCCVLA